MDTQIVTHTIYSILKHQDVPFSFQSRPKSAAFWSNIDSLNTPPPSFEGASPFFTSSVLNIGSEGLQLRI